jgi:hypothetical protein
MVPMERSDAAGPRLQIDASASAFAALHPPAGNEPGLKTTTQETTSRYLAKVAIDGAPGRGEGAARVEARFARYEPSLPLLPGVIHEGIAGLAAGAAAGAAAAAFGFALRAAFFFLAAFGAAAFFFFAATAFLTFFTFFAFAFDFFAFFAMFDLPIVWPMVQRSCRH